MEYGFFRLLFYDICSESQATKKITNLFIQSRAYPGDNSLTIVAFPLSFLKKESGIIKVHNHIKSKH